MKPFLAAFSLILLSLAAGCVEKTQEPGVLFVCQSGEIVSDSSGCKTSATPASIIVPEKIEPIEKPSTTIALVNDAPSSCRDLGCDGARFLGNKRTLKYHSCDCKYAINMSKGNRVCLKDAKEAEGMNYIPCRVCNPV